MEAACVSSLAAAAAAGASDAEPEAFPPRRVDEAMCEDRLCPRGRRRHSVGSACKDLIRERGRKIRRQSVASEGPPGDGTGGACSSNCGVQSVGVQSVDGSHPLPAEARDLRDLQPPADARDPRLPVEARDLRLPVRRARMVLRQAALATARTVFEREVLKEVIEEDNARWGGCITLPISILFFISYLLAVVFHEAVTYTHLTIVPIRTALKQPLEDVVTTDSVYDFLQHAYLPLFFTQYDAHGNPLPRDRWSILGKYSQLVGAVQMELQRSATRPCQELAEHVNCFPADELTSESFGKDPSLLPPPISSVPGSPWTLNGNWAWWNWRPANASAPSPPLPQLPTILNCAEEGFTTSGCVGNSRRLTQLRFEITSTMPMISSVDPSYKFLLDSRTPYAQLYNRIAYLKHRGWLDAQSTVLTLKAVVLNSQLGVPRIIFTNLRFFFSRGGLVFTDLIVEGKALDMWGDRKSYLADTFFVGMLVAQTCVGVMLVVRAVSTWRPSLLLNATFLFKAVTVVLSWFNLLFMVVQESRMERVRKHLEAYFVDPVTANSETFYESVTRMWYLASYARPLVAYANFFFLCQIIIALQWQPRLAVVTQTLLACSSDLFHYLIVLSLTVMGFALSGMVIFGRRIIDFADPVGAISFCFKLAIESEYDWPALSDKEYMTSFAWVVLYLLLVVMLMVNMVLAIIVDVYVEVRNFSGDDTAIPEHLQYIFRKLYYRRQWIADSDLLDQVAEMPRHVSVGELRTIFPEMHFHQLEYLQAQCMNKAARINRVSLSPAYTPQMVAAILFGLEEVRENLERLKARGWMAPGLETGSDESREWAKDLFGSIAAQNHWMSLAGRQISFLQLNMRGIMPQMEIEQQRLQRSKAGRATKARASQVL